MEPSSAPDDLMRFAGCTPAEWCLEETNNKARFEKNLLEQMTRQITQSDSFIERMNRLPWASEFIHDGWAAIGDISFRGKLAIDAYRLNSREMTMQLADLVNCFFVTWLRNYFRRKIVDPNHAIKVQPFTLEETGRFSEELDANTKLQIKENSKKWRSEYIRCYKAVLDSETWRRIGQRMGTFCRQVGCPDAGDDVTVALGALRSYNIALLRDTSSWELQVELKAKEDEIERLKDQLESYQKAIACLSYRSLVETLPNPQHRYDGTNEVIDRTSHWKDFLRAAKQQAKGFKPDDKLHPLHDIVNDKDAMKGGDGIYGTLSDNIHGFSKSRDARKGKEFDFKHSNFDPSKVIFLEAVKPRNWRNDGTIDWKKERERYGVVWEKDRPNGRKQKGGFMAIDDPDRPSQRSEEQEAGPVLEKGKRPAQPSLGSGEKDTLQSELNGSRRPSQTIDQMALSGKGTQRKGRSKASGRGGRGGSSAGSGP
jgi:hypothetical protein